QPLYKDVDWRYSDAKFPKHALPETPDDLHGVEKELLESMKDRCRWSLPVLMREQNPGKWVGKICGKDQKVVDLLYSKETGLEIAKQDHYEF
ncbi:MAG: hypothetical protein H3C47_15515, partial [Candidatus Cloacimonetes bacterium]|nr:hypothetical protein [Candidatus Cloacimonadota bacterium]